MGLGSAMFHGSMTFVGGEFDVHFIGIVAYLAHAMTTENLSCEGGCNPHILKQLSSTKRNITAIELTDKITQ